MKSGVSIGLLGSGLLLLLGGLLASCAPDTSAPALQARSDELQPVQPTSVAISLPATPVWVEPFIDQACLDCHIDEDQLVGLAKPDEPKETLSEGPG